MPEIFSGETTKNPWTVSVHGGVTVHPRGWVTVLPGSLEVNFFMESLILAQDERWLRA